MSDKQLDLELLEELECPVCLEYMTSPIELCENGHNICSSCKESLTQCPTCRGKVSNIRNITLEKFAATAVYPCKNVRNGCKETFTADDRYNHLAECLFQSRECPFRKLSGVDCPWTGVLPEIALHVLDEHDADEVPSHFKVILLDFVVGSRYRRAVICLGELFYLTWEAEGDILTFGVFHFGPKNETNDFKYGIKIGNSDGYDTATRKCHSYLEGGLKDLQPSNCVTLHLGAMQERIGEHGEFACEIEIGKLKLDGFVSEDVQEFIPVVLAISNS
jgi:E3 ubiquitin-protein ligase SIAH1